MKKFTIIAGLLALASLTSCKKDYECIGTYTYTDFDLVDGEFVEKEVTETDVAGQCLDCSKSDAEDAEATLKILGYDEVSCNEK